MSNDALLVPTKLIELLGVREHPGWTGAFSTKEFPGAIPNGTPIVKVKGDAGDGHDIGKHGRVLGSIQPLPWMELLYFVEWDDAPKMAFAVVNWKIAPIRQ